MPRSGCSAFYEVKKLLDIEKKRHFRKIKKMEKASTLLPFECIPSHNILAKSNEQIL